jgi:hypothetical protein
MNTGLPAALTPPLDIDPFDKLGEGSQDRLLRLKAFKSQFTVKGSESHDSEPLVIPSQVLYRVCTAMV